MKSPIDDVNGGDGGSRPVPPGYEPEKPSVVKKYGVYVLLGVVLLLVALSQCS